MSYFFDGEHTWPADSVMEFSFLNFFGNGHSAELAQFIKNNYTMAKKIPLRDNWKKILIYQSLRSLCFNQKYYVSPFNEMTNYINKYESKNAVKQLQTILASEKKEKSIMSNNFMDKDSLWWAKTIRFYKSIQNKKILSPADYKDIRVLNFIGLLSYSYTRNALQQNQMDMARKFLRIYQEADPYNSDMLYFWGVYFAKLNQSSRALDSLSKAVKLGFSDKSLAQSENSFLVLRDSLRFNDIVSRIK
jgi:tetratricopeptide (TPR) repeat protein